MSDDAGPDWTQLKYLLKTDPASIHFGCGHPEYLLSDLEKAFDECTKLGKNLWALMRRRSETWVDVSFMEFTQSDMDGSNLLVTHLMSSGGPSSDGLKECRHTYFGNECEGYVYYLDFEHMRLALKYLEEFFDGD